MIRERSAARLLLLAALVCVPGAGPDAGTRGLELRVELLQPVVGEPSQVLVREGETLLDIAFEHALGFEQLIALNPDVDVWIPEAGARVELPTQVVLPSAEPSGLLLNVPEMRLYDFRDPNGPRIVAAAVGESSQPTPTGRFKIGRKRVDPTWNVPESILAERPELPPRVPPGPDNPLGDRWMTLGNTSYGIHGTNNQWSIGHETTHGCVRLYNRDIRELFDRTPEGTPVTIIYQTMKLGRRGDAILLEVHPDIYGRDANRVASALVQLMVAGLDAHVDRELVERVVRDARGAPVRVGTLPPSPTSAPSS